MILALLLSTGTTIAIHDNELQTSLHKAATKGQKGTVTLLLKNEAYPQKKDQTDIHLFKLQNVTGISHIKNTAQPNKLKGYMPLEHVLLY